MIAMNVCCLSTLISAFRPAIIRAQCTGFDYDVEFDKHYYRHNPNSVEFAEIACAIEWALLENIVACGCEATGDLMKVGVMTIRVCEEADKRYRIEDAKLLGGVLTLYFSD